ncbi:putative RNA methyltransferase [Brachybacterium avium]|uniref:putative RNA methyltransferase n=1 Tax=Brachybacterium avium TaxID=2017485 RepID=UPI001FE8E007|nr:methyltransferase domain-containing protein [Brachybacterium avium]
MTRPAPAALTSWLEALQCPHCRHLLRLGERRLTCSSGHSFDLARAGYVSLLTGAPATSADDDDMARARDSFLATGAYAPLREALGELAPETARRILDIGGGTGYYLAGLLDELESARGLVIDTSVRALRFAARAHERAAAAAFDVFTRFPLADGSVDLVLDVFAPRNPSEFARVLAPGGHLLVVRPAVDHLAELRAAVAGMVGLDPRKEERLHAVLDPLFTTEAVREVRFPLAVSAQSAQDLVAMTRAPGTWHRRSSRSCRRGPSPSQWWRASTGGADHPPLPRAGSPGDAQPPSPILEGPRTSGKRERPWQIAAAYSSISTAPSRIAGWPRAHMRRPSTGRVRGGTWCCCAPVARPRS